MSIYAAPKNTVASGYELTGVNMHTVYNQLALCNNDRLCASALCIDCKYLSVRTTWSWHSEEVKLLKEFHLILNVKTGVHALVTIVNIVRGFG